MVEDPLYYAMIFAILVVFVVLMVGHGAFTKGGEFNREYSYRIMRYRLIAQAVAIGMILLFIILRGGGGV